VSSTPFLGPPSEDTRPADEIVLSLEDVSKDYPPPASMRLRRLFARLGGLHVEDSFAGDAIVGQEDEDDEDETAVDDEPLPEQVIVEHRVIDGVSLQANAASTVALVGREGAGKTVLLKLIAGIVAPTEGRVVVRGTVAPALNVMALVLPSRGHTVRAALPQIGAMVGIPPSVVRNRLDQIADLLESPALTKSSTSLMESRRKRQLILAMALSIEPDILLLDMPIPHDAFGDRCIRCLDDLRAHGTLIVAEMRDLHATRLTPDRVVVLDQGRILDSAPQDTSS
jgi:ABC-type polysaccharide/polyol phosphate transport system ATPase subunit